MAGAPGDEDPHSGLPDARARSAALSSSSQNAASIAVAVIVCRSVLGEPEPFGAHVILAADRRPEVRRIVRAEGQANSGVAQLGQRVLSKLGKTPSTTLLVGHVLSTISALGELATRAGSSIARTP